MIKKLLACLVFFMPLSAEVKVLAFAGSARQDSYNKTLVQEAAEIARTLGATVTVIDLKDYPIPIYDADLETKEGMPINARRIRNLMIESNAMIISSPEYNGSIPALLKNVLDWTSRTEDGKFSKVPYQGKKIAIMSASPGKKGGAKALPHLRAIIADCGGDVIPLQISVPTAYQAFDTKGHLINPQLKEDLKKEIQQLLQTTS